MFYTLRMPTQKQKVEKPHDALHENSRQEGPLLGEVMNNDVQLDRRLSALQQETEEAQRSLVTREPVLTTALLLKSLQRIDQLLDNKDNLGIMQALFARTGARLLEQAEKLTTIAQVLQQQLERSLVEERVGGMHRADLGEKNRAFVERIRTQIPEGLGLSPAGENALRVVTVGLIGDRIKQAEYVNDDVQEFTEEHASSDHRASFDLHRTMDDAFRHATRIDKIFPHKTFRELARRFHELCILLEDRLPRTVSLKLPNRHAK